MYKILLLFISLLFLFSETLSAQVKLDVQGHARIKGRLDLLVDHANTFIGFEAGLTNQDGSFNTFLGWRAGKDNSSGNGNTFIGSTAGKDNTTGSRNTIIGQTAGTLNTIGENNTFIGTASGLLNTEGSYNVFVGHASGTFNETGERNTFVGEEAGFSNTTGASNTFIGREAGFSNTTAVLNTFIGANAGLSNTTGYRNTFLGQDAGRASMAGDGNTFIGQAAGRTNTTGSSNTFVGLQAGWMNFEGIQNTFIGKDAGLNNFSTNGTFVGSKAGIANTAGINNTFIGEESGLNNTTGFENTFVGQESGYNNVTGSGLIAIGKSSSPASSSTYNAFTIGNRGLITRSHSGTLGNISMQSISGYVNWGTASDGRMKNNVQEDVHGLDFILQLRPVSYQLDALKLDNFLRHGMDKLSDEDMERPEKEQTVINETRQTYEGYLKEKSKIRYTGFIAQEVEEAMQQSDFDFSGLVKPAHEQDHYSLRYAEFVVPLVKGMQEQQVVIEEQAEKIKNQEQRIKIQEARLAQLEYLFQQLTINNSTIPNSTIDRQLSTENLTNAKLYPNQPNPFSESTLIRYYIPEGRVKPEIRITSLEGKPIKAIPIQATGKGQLTLSAQTLSPGTYLYSLFVNGELIATKQMVLLGNN